MPVVRRLGLATSGATARRVSAETKVSCVRMPRVTSFCWRAWQFSERSAMQKVSSFQRDRGPAVGDHRFPMNLRFCAARVSAEGASGGAGLHHLIGGSVSTPSSVIRARHGAWPHPHIKVTHSVPFEWLALMPSTTPSRVKENFGSSRRSFAKVMIPRASTRAPQCRALAHVKDAFHLAAHPAWHSADQPESERSISTLKCARSRFDAGAAAPTERSSAATKAVA